MDYGTLQWVDTFFFPDKTVAPQRSLSKSGLPLGQRVGGGGRDTEHCLQVPSREPYCLAVSTDGGEKHGFWC